MLNSLFGKVVQSVAIILSVSACVNNTTSTDAESGPVSVQADASAPFLRGKGEGKDYDWENDHIFVKVNSEESRGVLTLVQDNVKPGFDLGLHLHNTHTEIFYILEGVVDWNVNQETFTTEAGSVVYIPGSVPHAASSSVGAQMLMFYAPAGFDKMLEAIENASFIQSINPIAISRRNKKFDFRKATAESQPSSDWPDPLYVKPGEGNNTTDDSGDSTLKLSMEETGGLATMIEQNIKPGTSHQSTRPADQLEVLYVLEGQVEVEIDGQAQVAGDGTTVFFPAGVVSTVSSADGAKVLVYQTPGG